MPSPERKRKGWRRYKIKKLGTHCGRGDQYRKCLYPNFLIAVTVCSEIQARQDQHHTRSNSALHAYFCEVCGGAHVGHLFSDEEVMLYENDEPINIRQLQGLQ